MSLKKIEQVKKDKGFALFDLIIYGIILALVVVLFIVVFTAFNREPLSGVRISVRAETVFEYEFGGTAEYTEIAEVEEDERGITVTINTDYGLNVVYIDKIAKSVIMREADCNGRQCLYFPTMDDNSKFIYCNPHSLRVEPLFIDLESPDIIF